MSRLIVADHKTNCLLPPVEDCCGVDHLARFVVKAIKQPDLCLFTSKYAGRGSKAHHPANHWAMPVYGYATGGSGCGFDAGGGHGSDAGAQRQRASRAHTAQVASAARKQTREPIFDDVKSVMGFCQFSLRGLKETIVGWDLVYLAWNLKRIAVLRLKTP